VCLCANINLFTSSSTSSTSSSSLATNHHQSLNAFLASRSSSSSSLPQRRRTTEEEEEDKQLVTKNHSILDNTTNRAAVVVAGGAPNGLDERVVTTTSTATTIATLGEPSSSSSSSSSCDKKKDYLPMLPPVVLCVESLAVDELVLTNKVYTCHGQLPRNTYVKIGDCIFTCAEHSSQCLENVISMNQVQRNNCKLKIGNDVTVLPIQIPSDVLASHTLHSIGFELKPFLATRIPKGVISSDILADLQRDFFCNQIFHVGQTMVVSWANVKLCCTVTELLFANKSLDDLSSSSSSSYSKNLYEWGLLTNNTNIMFGTKRGCGLTLDSRQALVRQDVLQNFDFESVGIGGLNTELAQMFRRGFVSRFYTQSIKMFGIQHVKGVILYGPPGTGKTLIARQIGKMLNCREPQIINGPEVLNKYVGATEEKIRELFAPAEAEYAVRGDESELHLLIFDEIDALCKKRGSTQNGTGVLDSVVTQILSKMDGVDAINNVLVIGMTNRFDMLDDALLRPGRFEIHIEIGLPDKHGREQIFRIHTKTMRENHLLASNVCLEDLAAKTPNYSGAEISGIVRSAASFALSRHLDLGCMNPTNQVRNHDDIRNAILEVGDFERAIQEVHPAFGVVSQEKAALYMGGGGGGSQGLIRYGPAFVKLEKSARILIKQMGTTSSQRQYFSMLFYGDNGSGKTALAATLAMESGFPFVKFITSEDMIGQTESMKINTISCAFQDAYKSASSIVVLDDLERLIEYVPNGCRFNNNILQTLLVLIKKKPPLGRKLVVLATTSVFQYMDELQVTNVFSMRTFVPYLQGVHDILNVLLATNKSDEFEDAQEIAEYCAVRTGSVSIKALLTILETVVEYARNQEEDVTSTSSPLDRKITLAQFINYLDECGITL
jgi:vesicle-fusing ATPase